MRLATWNVNSLNVRLPQVLGWLQQQSEAGAPIDALALQELKLSDDQFPVEALANAGYVAHYFGQKTYNGVALITQKPLTDVQKNIPLFDDPQSRIIAGTMKLDNGAIVRLVSAYFPNGQAPESEKFAYKMQWLQALRLWLQSELKIHENVILMGDFNITFDDLDVWDSVLLKDTIHCTPQEREHLFALIDLGLVDAMRLFDQPERNYTWWDYREFAFKRKRGLRIDHVLVSQALQAAVQRCWVDVAPRRNERPSDHAPVVAELVIA